MNILENKFLYASIIVFLYIPICRRSFGKKAKALT
jgi:hypothetical protein